MTSPSEQEQAALDRLVQALATVQTIQQVRSALEAFPDVLGAAVDVLLEMPPIRGLITLNRIPAGRHPAERAMTLQNLIRRAGYLVSAARRLTTVIRTRDDLSAAVNKERQFLAQHLDAVAKRTLAARAVARVSHDSAMSGRDWDRDTGGLVGWYATLDDRTSAECRRAHGRNFDPTQIPRIGFPGAVHPHCRCEPGPPHRSGARVEELQPEDVSVTVSLDTTKFNAEIAAARQAGEWRISGGTV